MNPIFSIVIDCFANGKLSLWFQKKEKLTADQEQKLNELKARMERIIRDEATVKEFEFEKTTP